MALFKISKGPASALDKQPRTEGYCWFTPDDGKFYIDVSDTTRQILNAGHADTAEKDASGNVITETYETKIAANEKLTEAKNYTDTKFFVGTYSEYQTAYSENKIAVGALVVIIDDENVPEDSGATSAQLGKAVLGYMILGQN